MKQAVDQLSMPMRILLAVTLAFAALWFAALRPKPADEPAPTASVPAATPAAGVTEAAPAAAPTDATAAAPAPAPASGPVRVRAGRDRAVRAVLRDVRRRRTVVLLFAGAGADDRAVRRSVARLDRRGGAVAVHVAPIRRLAAYEPVVAGLNVQHAPTVLVIDRDRRVQAISGLTVKREIDEAISRARKR